MENSTSKRITQILRMNAPLTYYGGKQTLAPVIVEMLPEHKIYVEPFFGGGAVFWYKRPSWLEVINDNNHNLINFYLQTQNNYESLNWFIKNTINSEAQYLHAKDVWNERVDASDVEKAWAIWLITNGSFAGSMHGGWKWSNGTSGSHTGKYIENKARSFSRDVHLRLKNVQISCRNAIKVIEDRDSPVTVFYLDPPYPGSYQGHYRGYTMKMFNELLYTISQIQGKFILSSYHNQSLRYFTKTNSWNRKEIEVTIKTASLGNLVNNKRTEILTYNYDLKDKPKLLFA